MMAVIETFPIVMMGRSLSLQLWLEAIDSRHSWSAMTLMPASTNTFYFSVINMELKTAVIPKVTAWHGNLPNKQFLKFPKQCILSYHIIIFITIVIETIMIAAMSKTLQQITCNFFRFCSNIIFIKPSLIILLKFLVFLCFNFLVTMTTSNIPHFTLFHGLACTGLFNQNINSTRVKCFVCLTIRSYRIF